MSLPRTLVEAARAEVAAGRAPSLSAVIADALSEKFEDLTFEQVLDAMDKEYGPPSPEAEAWAQRVMQRTRG